MDASGGLLALWLRHVDGLGSPANGDAGKGRLRGFLLLYVVPLVPAVAIWQSATSLKPVAGYLIEGLSLFAAVLMGVFVQFAVWRARLDERAKDYWKTEAPVRRLVDSAAHGALVGVVASAIAVIPAILLGIDVGSEATWSPLLTYLSVMVFLMVGAIVRSAYMAYEGTTDPDVRRDDRDLRG